MERQGVHCVNATCPNVIRIQELVSKAEQEGRQVIIIGEPHHPEVVGEASWCAHPLIFQGPEELTIIIGVDNKDYAETIRVLYNAFVK